MDFEFSILYALQKIHSDVLDQIILILTKLLGSFGQGWLVIAAILLLFRKTRKAGFAVILSYAMVFLLGQYGLKALISRARPCQIDETVALLVVRPGSSSFPSTHAAWAFAAATSIFCFHKKTGVAALVLACIVGFSRLYLFVHFPTDVLAGAVLGIAAALLAAWIVKSAASRIAARKKAA